MAVGGLCGVFIAWTLIGLTVGLDTNIWLIRLLTFSSGFAIGWCVIAVQTSSFATISSADTGRASALFQTQNRSRAGSAWPVLVTVVSAIQPAGATGAALIPAFHYAFLTAAAVVAIGVLIALTIRDADAAATMRRRERIPAPRAAPGRGPARDRRRHRGPRVVVRRPLAVVHTGRTVRSVIHSTQETVKPMNARPLHFSAFIWPNGYHESAWRVVDDDVRGVLGLPYYAGIARVAERGLMDAIFLADNIAIAEYRATYLPQTQFDPISVLSALAAVTSDIGLIGTGSTTYSKPWELARRFATLDHLSGGRAGWNIVTTVTPLAAAAFGEPAHPDHADRYARAHEFVDATIRAWDSWEDDAVIGDREHGVWADRGKLHDPVFHGQYYDTEGILPFPRSPQGRPVLVQAGQSAAGIGLAARYAELVFSARHR